MLDISVIIVNWNSKDYVRQCLASLFKHCSNVEMEIIVVDGASFDGCDEMLAREFPSVKFVQSDKNVGFAKANNLGVRQAKGRNFLLLNPDTEFLENSIEILIRHLSTLPQAGAVGCKLLNTDRTLQTSCVQSFPTVLNQILDSEFLRRLSPRSSLWGMATLYSDDPKPGEVEAISGACILVKRQVFESVRGFTENYFMYGEDLDLSFKIERAGFRRYYVPETSIVHHGGGSTRNSVSNFSSVMMRESVFRFLQSNRGTVSAALYRVAMAATSFARMLVILPLLMVSGNRVVQHGSASLQKWKAILRWSCGLDSRLRPSP